MSKQMQQKTKWYKNTKIQPVFNEKIETEYESDNLLNYEVQIPKKKVFIALFQIKKKEIDEMLKQKDEYIRSMLKSKALDSEVEISDYLIIDPLTLRLTLDDFIKNFETKKKET